MVAFYKPYAERYMGLVKDLMENPPEETPGWHSSELETSQMLAHNAKLVRMDRATHTETHIPSWLPSAFKKADGAPDQILLAKLWKRVEQLERTCRNLDSTQLPATACSPVAANG